MKITTENEEKTLRAPTDTRIVATIQAIESDERVWPTARALASHAGLSEFHFNRLFHQQMGESVSTYIRRHKLDMAAMRLRWTHDTILQVASSVGYKSQEAFTRAFKARFGVTPGRYQLPEQSWAIKADDDTSSRITRVRNIESLRCLRKRYIGAYTDVGQHWQRFLDELAAHVNIPPNAFFAGLTRDDPRVTPWNEIRYDCSLILPSSLPQDPLALQEFGFTLFETYAGPYVCLRHTGPYKFVGASYSLLMDQWMRSQTRYYGMPDEPAIELYRAPGAFANPDTLDFEIMMALY